jgi:hypothetical protein
MSEWLTTGQIIDRLKVGEIAQVQEKIKKEYVTKTDASYFWCDKNGWILDSGEIFYLNDVISKMKWRILPKYVSFEEAMKALKVGKTVYCHPSWCSGKYKIEPHEARDNALEFLSIKGEGLLQIVFESKWAIEEGENK